MTNIGGRYVLNPSQMLKMKEKNVINPFTATMNNSAYGLEPVYVMKKQDFAVNHSNAIVGEGGVGSGKALDSEDRFGSSYNPDDPNMKARRYAQIKNAQRKYRSENRDDYNKYMRKLYASMKSSNDTVGTFIGGVPSVRYGKDMKTGGQHSYAGDTSNTRQWYEHRLEKARKANDLYRKKKKADEMLKNLDKIIEKELKAKFKKEFKNKKGRPGKTNVKNVFDPNSEWYKENAEKLKIEKQEELKNKGTIIPYKDRIKKEKPEYPLGKYKTNKDGENVLIEAIDDIAVKDRVEYDASPEEYKKKREKKKAPPVTKSKPSENITMAIEEKEKEKEKVKEDKDKALYTRKVGETKIPIYEKDLTEKQKIVYDAILDYNNPKKNKNATSATKMDVGKIGNSEQLDLLYNKIMMTGSLIPKNNQLSSSK